jgi:hypothetical protein
MELLNNKYVQIILGILEKITLISIVLKLLNIINISWIYVLIPLWCALIFGGLISLYVFIIEMIKISKV